MTTAALKTPSAVTEPRVPFRRLLKSEWIKLRSLRSVVTGLALAAAGVLYCNVNAAIADRALAPRGAFVLQDVFTNNAHIVVLYVFGALGAIVIVSEHSSGLIRTTFAAVPDRSAVLHAKAAVVAAVTTIAGLLAVAVSYLAVQLISDGQPTFQPLRFGQVQLYLACSVLLFPVSALIGLGLGTLIRHGAVTMVAVITVLAVLPQFVDSQKYAWVNDLHNATPFAAWQRLRMGDIRVPFPAPVQHVFAPPTLTGAWLVYAAWPVIAVALATIVVRRRDV